MEIVNQSLSNTIAAIASGRGDGDTKSSGLILAGNEILEAYKVVGGSRLRLALLHLSNLATLQYTVWLNGINVLQISETNSNLLLPKCSLQISEQVAGQQTAFRQLESILSFYRFTRSGRYSDALMELSKLAFLPMGSRTLESSTEALRDTSLSV